MTASSTPATRCSRSCRCGSTPTATTPLLFRTDAPYLAKIVDGRVVVLDYGIQNADGSWGLASGAPVLDANGAAIAAPTLADVLAQVPPDGDGWRVENIGYNPYAAIAVPTIALDVVDGAVVDYTVQLTDKDGAFTVWARNLDRALALQAKVGDARGFNLRNYAVDFAALQLQAESTDDSRYRIELLTPAELNFALELDSVRFEPQLLSGSIDSATGVISYAINDQGQNSLSATAYVSGIQQTIGLLNTLFDEYITVSRATAVTIALQGGLSQFAQGLSYDATNGQYAPTTKQQLAPVFTAILDAAPADNTNNAIAIYLQQWNEILWQVYPNYQISPGDTISGGSVPFDQMFLLQQIIEGFENSTINYDIVQDVQDKPLTILPAEAFGNDVDPLGNVLFFGSATPLGQLDTKYLSKNVQFSALTVRGKALPAWLSFDNSTMTFSGAMPPELNGHFDVEVKTFDPDNGNSFVHYFSFGPNGNAVLGQSLQSKVLAGYAIRGDFLESFDYGGTGVGATVSVSVTMADGSALPAWLAFDAKTLTLLGGAPGGTAPFAVLATYSYLDPTSGATQVLRRNVVVDPATVASGIALNSHIAALALGAGIWDAHMAGNQPLPEWLDFDPKTQTLAFSAYAPDVTAKPARIDIDFVPTPQTEPDSTHASSHGGFTLEFVIDPNAPLDPAITTLLANSAYFAQQNELGIDLSRAVSITASLADGNPLPDWLVFDAKTLRFSGSPPPQYVGSVPVRLDVIGDGLHTPNLSILTDVVVDATFKTLPSFGLTTSVTPELVTIGTPIAHDNGSIAVQYTSVDEKGTASTNSAVDVVDIAPRLVAISAVDDSVSVVQGHSVTFTLDDLLANDRDDNGDYFRVIDITQPAHGTLAITNARYDLAPPASLTPSATGVFSATLANGTALANWMTLDPATGIIVAQPPIDVFGVYTVTYTLSSGGATQTAQASYQIDGNQGVSFVYTPDPAYAGNDGVVYTLTDDKQIPVTAHVTLHVAQALVANDDMFATTSDATLDLSVAQLLANDVSADSRPLTITAIGTPSAGNLTFDGSIVAYTSTHYYDGKVTFQYTVADDEGHRETANVTLDNGQNYITAGSGYDSVRVGSGVNTIRLAGGYNTVTLGAGTDTVNGGSYDGITIGATRLTLAGGVHEAVYLGNGAAFVDDLSTGTSIVAGANPGSTVVQDFLRDATSVLDLRGGAGGFKTVAGVMAALADDGKGGTMLALGGGATIEFVAASHAAFTAAHFRIG